MKTDAPPKWLSSVRLILALGTALSLFLLLTLTLTAAPVGIDTFDDGYQYYRVPPIPDAPTNYGYTNTTAALGGQRDIYITRTSTGSNVGIIVDDEGEVYGAPNLLVFDQGAGGLGWAEVVWDGPDNNALVLDTTGLGGEDLTGNGTNDGIQLIVVSTEGSFALGMWVYSGTRTAYYTLTTPSGRIDPPGRTYFIPLSQFQGDTSVFTSAGAVVFRIMPALPSNDMRLDLLEFTAQTDWGDLPDTYSTTLASNGPRHVYTGTPQIWLGATIDLETDGFPGASANGDDTNNLDDEDGIERVPGYQWASGNTVWITATVTGGSGDLYAWFDWNGNGSFADETPVSWTGLSEGVHQLSLVVPSGYGTGNALAARFRLVPAGASAPDYYGSVENGEVEDYWWQFTPTGVGLRRLEATPLRAGWALAGLFLFGAGLWAVWRWRA